MTPMVPLYNAKVMSAMKKDLRLRTPATTRSTAACGPPTPIRDENVQSLQRLLNALLTLFLIALPTFFFLWLPRTRRV